MILNEIRVILYDFYLIIFRNWDDFSFVFVLIFNCRWISI